MSSQPNQSLIDGIRCLQYLVSSDRAIGGRELARQMGMNSTRVNRLLMTMASIGLTVHEQQRRYLPGPGVHALAAQAIRGSSLFAQALPQLELYAPPDIVVALGVLWEDQVIYIWHSEPGERTRTSQALAGFRMLPAWQSVIGIALLAAEPDVQLQPRFAAAQWTQMAPLLARKRQSDHLIWQRDDGEIGMALPINHNRAALAFAKIWQRDDEHLAQRVAQLKALAQKITAEQ